MKKQEILDIAKELILISAKYFWKITEENKKKLFNKFDEYEKKLEKDNTKYSKTILEFVLDLKNDLLSGRKLNIDKISSDEYLENYLITKNELKIYNSLIDLKIYREIFDGLNTKNYNNKKIDELLEKFIKNFLKNSKKLNSKIIAQNILIFTSFDRIIASKYLKNLYLFLNENSQKQKILDLINFENRKIFKVKQYSIKFYQKNNFNYKYLGFKNINWKTILSEKIVDCSKIEERTWLAKYEYKKLLKQL